MVNVMLWLLKNTAIHYIISLTFGSTEIGRGVSDLPTCGLSELDTIEVAESDD